MGLKQVAPVLYGRAVSRAITNSVHAVHFYETDAFLIETLAAYVSGALRSNEAAVVIATAEHTAAMLVSLSAGGIDVATAQARSRLIVLDAHATLAQITVDGALDRDLFNTVIGGTIARARGDEPSLPVRAFGEMVAILWARGLPEVALELEVAWAALIHASRTALICAYPVSVFSEVDRASGLVEAVRMAHEPLHKSA